MKSRVSPFVLRYRTGFTLLETLIVLALVLVLAALALGGVQRARSAADSARCMTNMRRVGEIILRYAAENNNRLIPTIVYTNPAATAGEPWNYQLHDAGYLLRESYSGLRESIMNCPERDLVVTSAYNRLHYGMNWNPGFINTMRKGQPAFNLSRVKNLTKTMLIGEVQRFYMIQSSNLTQVAYPHRGGGNIIFMDGHGEYFHGPWKTPKSGDSYPFY